MKSTITQEIIWLHLKDNPGLSVLEIQEQLGIASAQGMIRGMFMARQLDRTTGEKEIAGYPAPIQFFCYTAAGTEFKAVSGMRKAKPAKGAVRTFAQDVATVRKQLDAVKVAPIRVEAQSQVAGASSRGTGLDLAAISAALKPATARAQWDAQQPASTVIRQAPPAPTPADTADNMMQHMSIAVAKQLYIRLHTAFAVAA